MDYAVIAERLGVPILALAFIGVALWRAAVFMGHRLFDADTGIVTRVTNRHITFLDSLDEQTKTLTSQLEASQTADHGQTQMLVRIAAEIQWLVTELRKEDSPFSNHRTNSAIHQLARCLESLAAEWQVDISESIQRIERILDTRDQTS